MVELPARCQFHCTGTGRQMDGTGQACVSHLELSREISNRDANGLSTVPIPIHQMSQINPFYSISQQSSPSDFSRTRLNRNAKNQRFTKKSK